MFFHSSSEGDSDSCKGSDDEGHVVIIEEDCGRVVVNIDDLSQDLDYLESFVDADNFRVVEDTEDEDGQDPNDGIDIDDQIHYEVQEVLDQDEVEVVVTQSQIHDILMYGTLDPSPADMMSLEDSFCKNFTCCGLVLDDMHELLAHYEECHVQLDVNSEDDDSVSFVEIPTVSDYGGRYIGSGNIQNYSVSAFEDEECISAFDDSVIRLPSHTSPAINDYNNPLIRRVGDVEDDLGVSMLEWIHEECERDGKRLKMMSEVMGIDPHCSSDEEVDVVTVDNQSRKKSTDSESNSLDDESKNDKPYRCSYPGCDKAYKNPNGLKYHNLHGHSKCENDDSDYASRLMKPYVCNYAQCFKRYKNLNGLKYHIEKTHGYTKTEANQMATDIVKKTNARYGINARSVPAPILFAAMKEHEDKERIANGELVVSNDESAVKPEISNLSSDPESGVVSSVMNVSLVPLVNEGSSAMIQRTAAPNNISLPLTHNQSMPIKPKSQPHKVCIPQTIVAKTNSGKAQQTRAGVIAGIPPYIQALAASGFIDLNNYITAFQSLAANNGKFSFNNNSADSNKN